MQRFGLHSLFSSVQRIKGCLDRMSTVSVLHNFQPTQLFTFLLPNILLAMILCFQITSGNIKQCQTQHWA